MRRRVLWGLGVLALFWTLWGSWWAWWSPVTGEGDLDRPIIRVGTAPK
jgi:hypothetical protein